MIRGLEHLSYEDKLKGLVQFGDEKAAGRLPYGLPVFKERLQTGVKSTFNTGR